MLTGARSPKPSVLLVANFLGGSRATQTYSEELASQLTGAGWKISTASSVPRRLPRLLDMMGTAWRKRREYAVAHVEVYSGPAFIWAELTCLALRFARRPYILSLRGGSLPVFASRWPGRVRRLLGSARAVAVPSGYLLEKMRPFRTDLRLLPNSIDLERYRFRARTHPRPLLLWLRAFHQIYNPLLAIQVVASLAKDFPDVQLTMIGPDTGDGSLQAAARMSTDLGIADRVSLRGPVPKSEVANWLSQADIFLNTPNVDNTPISVLEAMASGLCVVSTDVGGLRYLMAHERDALLVPPAEPESFALAVRRLLTEPALAGTLSVNGRRKATESAWKSVLPAWERLLTEAADGRGRRGQA